MKKLTAFLALAALCCLGAAPAIGQGVSTVFEEWNTQEGTQNHFYLSKTVTDGSNNVYKTGSTLNANGNYDILTVKYNSSGVQQWASTYAGAGAGDDFGNGLKVDGSGNVFVVGSYYKNSTDSNNVVLIKYNASGTQQWAAVYDGGQGRSDAGAALEISGTDIYVCGSTYTNSTDQYDMLLLKYNSSGTQQWARQWDNVDLWDGAYKIGVRNGVVTLNGGTQTTSTRYDYATVQWSTAGVFGSATLAGGSNSIGFNKITGMAMDATGNIYVTGAAMNATYDMYTVKYDAALTPVWSATYNGSSSLDDVAHDIAVDGSGNVYVTGYTRTAAQGKNFATVKYNSSGTQQWVKTFNGLDSLEDEAYAVALNSTGQVFVTGASVQRGNHDFYTLKYDPSSSNVLWEISYNSLKSVKDRPSDICVDNAGAILVAGQVEEPDGFKYATVKYVEKSIITPPDTTASTAGLCFTEHRGQIHKSNDKTTSAAEVKFYAKQNIPSLYFGDNKVSYVWGKVDTVYSTTDTLYRVDMSFNNISSTGVIRAMNKRSDYEVYYKPHIPGGRMVSTYDKLVCPELYNKVDVMYAANGGGMKYYFIIHPGGSASSISWSYTGASGVYVSSNKLYIRCPIDTIDYERPTAYQVDANGNRVNLSWAPTYSLSGSTVTLANIGTYDNTKALVIEVARAVWCNAWGPQKNLSWSTFYGGNHHDGYNAIKTTPGARVWCVGDSSSDTYPVTAGSSNPTIGDIDAVMTRFSLWGPREYSTCYGGSNNDIAKGVSYVSTPIVAPVVVGYTSSSDFPVMGSGKKYIATHSGGRDGFIVILSSDTSQKWATCWGGAGFEEFNDVTTINGEVYVVGSGRGSSPYKTKTGAYNPTVTITNPQPKWGVIAHFNPQDSLVWATHLGTELRGIAGNGNQWIYVTGAVDTPRVVPMVNLTGGYQDPDGLCGGSRDMVLARFNSSDTLIWSTYYGGSGIDEGNQLRLCNGYLDNPGFLYAVGTTYSSDFPLQYAGPQYIDSTYNGSGDAAMLRFSNTSGARSWASYIGSTYQDVGVDVTTDAFDNPFFMAATYYNMPWYQYGTSPNDWLDMSYPGTANTHRDVHLLMLKYGTLQPQWGTNFSNNGNEHGYSLDVAVS
jgi:hypothetical protein